MERNKPVVSVLESPIQSTQLRTQEWLLRLATTTDDPDELLKWLQAEMRGPLLRDIAAAADSNDAWFRVAVEDQCRLLRKHVNSRTFKLPDVGIKVAVGLAARGLWDDLGEFISKGGFSLPKLPSIPTQDGVEYPLPMLGRLREVLDPSELQVSPEAMPGVATLDACTWLGDQMLQIGGVAFIAGLPSDPGSLEIALVLTDAAGNRRRVNVTRENNPRLATTEQDPWGYYGEAGFTAAIDVAALVSSAPDAPGRGQLAVWDAAVELTVAGSTRRIAFQQLSHGRVMRTILSERIAGNVFASPEFSSEDGLQLVLRRAAVMVEGLEATGRSVTLELREADPRLHFVKVVAQLGTRMVEADIETRPDGTGSAGLDLPDITEAGNVFPQWTLRAVTESGVQRGLGWGLTRSASGSHVPAERGAVVAAANAAGNLSLLDSNAFLLVESVSLEPGGYLHLVVQAPDPKSAPKVQLQGKTTVRPTSVRAVPQGGFEIVIPVPRPGEYKLICESNVVGEAGAPVVRVGSGLAGEDAFMANGEVTVRLAARTQRGLDISVRSAAARPAARQYVPGLLSVVIPMHNADVYLRDCLESVAGQSYQNLEIVVVDDGSTDVSAESVRDFCVRDPRVRVIPQDRSGPGAARDRGVLSARGEFLAFVDADDMVVEDGFARLIAALSKSKSDFAVAGVQVFQGQKLLPVPWPTLLNHSPRSRQSLATSPVALRHMTAVGAVFRTSFWNSKVPGFGQSGAFESDGPMLAAYTTGTFDLLPDVVYRWRLWTQREKQADEQIMVHRARHILPSWRSTAGALAGSADQLRDFESHFLEDVLLKNALLAVSHNFAELRELAQQSCREVLAEVCSRSWFDLSLHNRIVLQLVAANQFGLLAQFLEHNAPNFAYAPRERTTEGLVYSAPMAEQIAPYLSEDTLLRPYASLPAKSLLTSVRWAEDEKILLIEGAAYIDGLAADPSSLHIGLELVGPEGHVYPAEVQRTVDPRIDQFAKDPHNSYAQACFVARIDFDGVIDDEALPGRPGFIQTYAVRLKLHTPEAERTCALDRSHHFRVMQTLRSREHNRQIWITPEFSKADGLRIRLRRSAVTAVHASVDERTLRLSLEESGPQLRFKFLRLSMAGTVIQTDLDRDANGRLHGSLEVPDNVWPAASSDLRHWTVDAVTEDGRTRRIGWALDSAATAEGAVANQDRSLRLTPTNQGNVTLTDDPLWTTVVRTHLGADLDSLIVHVLTRSPDLLPAFELSSDRHTLNAPKVKSLGGGLFELTFDLAVEDWGRQRPVPPSGRYYLRRVGRAPGLPSYSSVTRVAPDLAARSNRLDCSRVAIHLGASHTGTFRLTFQPVLTPEEKTQLGQLALYRRHVENPALPLDPDAFFFRCYFGEVANDSQVELHKEVRRRWPQAKLYWEVSDFSVVLPEGGIPVVKRSEAWYEARSTATYTFSNNDADWWKLRRHGQTVVQTFHGHPFKRMGRSRWLSLGAGPERIQHRTEVKNDQWSHILSQSPKATELYVQEYGFRGQMLELGYPRNDVFKGAQAARTAAETRSLLGIDPSKTVVLYAPTWRESDQKSTTETVVSDLFDARKIAEELGPDYVLLMRGHRYSSGSGPVDRGAARIIDVTAYPDSADLCLASDIGVFDYSSIRFDYAVTGKPMILYVPDYSLYENERGWLFPYEDSAPGPLVFREDDLVGYIRDVSKWLEIYASQYAAFIETYAPYDDGNAASRVIASVVKLSEGA